MTTPASYRQRLQLDEAALRSRLAFYRIEDADLARLASLRPMMEARASDVVNAFYEHLLAHPATRAYLDAPGLIPRLQRKQAAYFLGLFQGRIDAAYLEERLRVGAAHERLGVPTWWYLGAYARYLDIARAMILELLPGAEGEEAYRSLLKVVHFDAALAQDAYLVAHLEANQRHQAALRELSTPVIQVYERVVLLPLVGTVDSNRAQQVMETVLEAISFRQAKVLLLDIAGVPVVDTQVADHLLKTTAAVRLLGSEVILTGISAQVARTIVELGVDISSMHTRNRLADGLELALRIVGRRVVDIP